MKKTQITTMIVSAILLGTVSARPFNGKGKAGLKKGELQENRADRLADREELLLDRVDSKLLLKDPECGDHRHADIIHYTNHTARRIVKLAIRGALTEDQAKAFDDRHEVIVARAKATKKETGKVDTAALRASLNTLNDDINKAIIAADEGDKRTPLLNLTQHRFEEKIEFGEKTGRLSKGEASSLRRKVASLKKLEARMKDGEALSEREREKLMKEALEVRREIEKELRD